MAYSDQVITRAKHYFYWNFSYHKIARKLVEEFDECKTITPSTIQAWATKKDSLDKTWSDYRDDVRTEREKTQAKIVNQTMKQVVGEMTDLLPEILEKLKKKEFSSLEGAIYAFTNFVNQYRDLTGEKKPLVIRIDGNNIEAVSKLFSAIESIPGVAALLEENRDLIEPLLKDVTATTEKRESEKMIGGQDGTSSGE